MSLDYVGLLVAAMAVLLGLLFVFRYQPPLDTATMGYSQPASGSTVVLKAGVSPSLGVDCVAAVFPIR
jgi:hypothetical protein